MDSLPMGPSSPTYDVGTPTTDNEIQSMKGMAILAVEFSREGYKIRKVFG